MSHSESKNTTTNATSVMGKATTGHQPKFPSWRSITPNCTAMANQLTHTSAVDADPVPISHCTTSAPALTGKQSIIDYYSAMASTVREAVEVQSVIFDEHAVSAHVFSTFTAVADAPDFPVGALQKGQAWRVPLNVNYTLRDGLISRIEVSRLGEPTLIEAAGR